MVKAKQKDLKTILSSVSRSQAWPQTLQSPRKKNPNQQLFLFSLPLILGFRNAHIKYGFVSP